MCVYFVEEAAHINFKKQLSTIKYNFILYQNRRSKNEEMKLNRFHFATRIDPS